MMEIPDKSEIIGGMASLASRRSRCVAHLAMIDERIAEGASMLAQCEVREKAEAEAETTAHVEL